MIQKMIHVTTLNNLLYLLMLLVGLTGGIGSGKSVVAKYLRDNGIPVIDADEVAKYVVEPGRHEYELLRQEFGSEYFDDENDDGRLKRQELGELVFNDAEKRKRLNRIIHAAVKREMILKVLKALVSLHKIIVLDVPLLFEIGMNRFVHQTILVTCDKQIQMDRVQTRDGLTESQVLARVNAQMTNEEKAKLATFIIDNNGLLESTKRQTLTIISNLRTSWNPFIFRSTVALIFSAVLYLLLKFYI